MTDQDRRTGEERRDDDTISERTKVDLKTLVLVVTGALGLAGAMTRAEMSMRAMDADLNAKIIAVQYAHDKSEGDVNNRLANLEATTCAIAKKIDAPTLRCP